MRGIGGAYWHRRDACVRRISAKRNVFDTASSHLPRVLRERRAPPSLPLAARWRLTTGPTSSPPRRQLFESDFLNFFSRVHPAIPAVVFVPGDRRDGVARRRPRLRRLAAGPAHASAGSAIWTLTEYWLHRLVFHWEPDNAFGRRMHFIIHGIHHDHPNDKLRLVMPPAVAIPLAALFFVAFCADLRHAGRLPALRRLHRSATSSTTTRTTTCTTSCPSPNFGKRLREQHMRHHFQDHRYGYGVSSPLWDVVFRTLPRKRSSQLEAAARS